MLMKELLWDWGSWQTSEDKWKALHYKEWECKIHLLLSVFPESKTSNLTLKTTEPAQQAWDEYTPDQMQITEAYI